MLRYAVAVALIASTVLVRDIYADEAGELKEKIFAVWKAREEKVPRFKVVWDAETYETPEMRQAINMSVRSIEELEKIPGRTTKKVGEQLAMDGSKLSYRYYMNGHDDQSRYICNGDQSTDYFWTVSKGAHGQAQLHNNGRFGMANVVNVVPVLLLYRPLSLLQMSKMPRDLSIDPGVQRVNGKSCIVASYLNAESFSVTRYYLDIEHGYIVRRIENRFTEEITRKLLPNWDGMSNTNQSLVDIEYRNEDGEIPEISSWKFTTWNPQNLTTVYVENTSRVQRVHIGEEIPASEFDLHSYPVGALVISFEDGKEKEAWVAGENGQRITDSQPEGPPAHQDGIKELLDESSGSSWSLWGLIGSACVLAVAVWLWRSRQS